jgi:broad specificity phosphatase PhoE
VLTLVLSRHGATPRSDPEQHLGQRVDIELSDIGREAAAVLSRRLAGITFDRIIASPLRRARETAAAVAEGAHVETDARLAEMDYGRWEGMTYAQIDATDAEYRRQWEADPAGLRCPDGESGEDVAARVRGFIDELVGDGSGPDATVLAIGHSTTNRVLLATVLDVPLIEYRRRFRQDQTNVTVLRFKGAAAEGAQLLLGNDMAHVRGTEGRSWDPGGGSPDACHCETG